MNSKKLNFNLYFLILIFISIFSLIYAKFFSFNINYYDHIYYLQKYINSPNNFDDYLNNNLNLLFYLFSSLINFVTSNTDFKIIILLITNSICLISPLFILRNNKQFIILSFIFLTSPFFWYNAIHSFQPDIFVVPLIMMSLNYIEEDKQISFLFTLILIILVKKVFILISIGLIISYFFQKNTNPLKYKFFYFFLFFFILYVIFSYINRLPQNNNFLNFSSLFSIKLVFHFLITIFIIFFHFHIYKFNSKVYLIFLPLLFFYFVYPSPNLKKYYYHYYISLLPICIFYLSKLEFNKSFVKYICFINCLVLLFFSTSPLSIWFYSHKSFKYNNFLFNENYYQNVQVNEYLYSYDHNISKLLISNDFGNLNLLDKYEIAVYPDFDYFDVKHFLVISSKNKFYYDQNCLNNSSNVCNESNIAKYLNQIYENYILINQIGYYKIYVSK